ncbi:adenylate/guanylate cyclase domain-containing protein [Microvirga guangxiensis]|uniref:SAM domain (Sterile alpha motif) n=1 Tax=Microvirga guangxiensis TaxID=549386 RepID=A0A1G5EYA8_9HYPH|nr:adenylate/guanylate cyclase domain-containing protein [Microvirga guangxiensis]SCY31989.1 SAM domain (Sterile alpha motif) [Microvirga guangxiensis]
MIDVARWLVEQGLEQYAEVFAANALEGEVLFSLTEADLKDLGISALGHRKKLLRSLAALQAQQELATTRPSRESQNTSAGFAERRQLTVLFCDLVGSTELSARLDPEDLREVISAYHDACIQVAARVEAYVARFLGDGVLIYFGWPQAHEDDADRAVSTGLALIEAINHLKPPGGAQLQARIGIATGPVVIGDLSGREAADTVIGETPNLAARLQAIAEPGAVLISPITRRLVDGLFELEDLGPQNLKGFANALTVWRVKSEIRANDRFEAKHPVGYTHLVGREEELSLFLRRWQQVKGGEGQVILLSGPAGIGKSRLVLELREQLSGETYVAPRLQGTPYHISTPLYPVIQHFENAADVKRDDPPEVKLDKIEALLARNTGDLDPAVPLMAAVLGIPTGSRYTLPELTPQRQKQLTLEVIFQQLEGLTAGCPVLFICEDAQWLDPTTLDFLELVIERIECLKVMLIVTARPEFSPPWDSSGHMTALSLNGLPRDQGVSIVEQMTKGKSLPGSLLQEILERADGVPLFIEELTREVIESGIVIDEGNSYALAGPLFPPVIPATLHDSLLARLDRLGKAKEIAQIGAAIGRDFSFPLLAAVAERPQEELRDMVEQLVTSGLVQPSGSPDTGVYSFKHALVRDTAYESLLKSRRRQIHSGIASALESQRPETKDIQPELLAHHYAGAGQTQEAADYWRRAAERTIEHFANSEAIAHCDRAIMQLRTLPPAPERIRAELEVQLIKGVAVRAAKGYSVPESEEVFLRACELCETLGDRVNLVHALRGLFGAYYVAARWSDAERVAERICAATDGLDDRVLLCIRWTMDGAARLFRGEPADACTCLQRALDCYDEKDREIHIRLTGHEMASLIRFHLAIAEWLSGKLDRAMRTSAEAVDIARSAMQPFSLAQALGNIALLQILARNFDAAKELTRETVEISVQHGIPDYILFGNLLAGTLTAIEGDLRNGNRLAQESMVGLHRAGWRCLIPILLVHIAAAAERAEETDMGHEIARNALSMIRDSGEAIWEAEALRIQALIKMACGADSAEAEDILHAAIDLARRQKAKAFQIRSAVSLAHLWMRQGKLHESQSLLGPIYAEITEVFGAPDLVEARMLLDKHH